LKYREDTIKILGLDTNTIVRDGEN